MTGISYNTVVPTDLNREGTGKPLAGPIYVFEVNSTLSGENMHCAVKFFSDSLLLCIQYL